MSNANIKKISFSRKRLELAMKHRGTNYDRVITECNKSDDTYLRSQRQMKEYKKCGEMPPDVLDRLAKHLDVSPDYLTGALPSEDIDPMLLALQPKILDPGRYPYARKEADELSAEKYYRAILAAHEISFENEFLWLTPKERFNLQNDLEIAIVPVLQKYFTERRQDQFGLWGYGIYNIEEAYSSFGLDYWTDKDYLKKIAEIYNKIDEDSAKMVKKTLSKEAVDDDPFLQKYGILEEDV